MTLYLSQSFSFWFGITLAVVSAGVGAWTLYYGWVGRTADGMAVRRLGRRLGLSHADRRTLRAIARRAGMPGPAPLIISRGCFDRAARQYRGRDPQQVGRLRRRIFD
jgi:hypothetical protein